MLNLFGLTKILVQPDKKKIILILTLMGFFTLLLTLCNDDEFGGIRESHELLKSIHTKFHKNEKKNKLLKKIKHKLHIDENSKYETKIKTFVKKIFDRFYYISVCTTSLGFGDIYPDSFKTRFITILYILILFYIFFLSLKK